MKKTKKIIVVCLSVLLLVGLLCSCNNKNENKLSFPTASNAIELRNDNFISALTEYCHSGATFELMEDINLTGEWKPIGRTLSTAFNGTIKGNGHTISGLKITGWDASGNPLYIAKRIMGWKKDGVTPVYRSAEIVAMDSQSSSVYLDGKNDEGILDDLTEIKSMIYEGDDADENFAEMKKSGYIEESTSYGSVGLFGYTYGASFSDFTIVNADLSFYGEGENVYAGILSGYDIASSFEKITVKQSKLLASDIRASEITYSYETAKPISTSVGESRTKQYLGGLVGYVHNKSVTENAKFNDITIENVVVDNNNHSAYFDIGMTAQYYDLYNPDNSEILTTKLSAEDIGKLNDEAFRKSLYTVESAANFQGFVGGVAGFMYGAELKKITVNGLNTDNSGDLCSQKINAGGVTAALLGSTSFIENATIKNVSFVGVDIGKSALVGGAFGEVRGAKAADLTDGSKVEGLTIKIGTLTPDSVCIAGFAAYCDEKADIENVSVEGATLISNYIASGELGSIMAGIVGVLRDSTLCGDSSAKDVSFVIEGSETVNDFCFTRDIVSQVYGNSVVKNVSASNCTAGAAEYKEIVPIPAKNNYVNENGESSIRLYYTVDGKQAGVYVTVFGEVIPFMKGTLYQMEEETIYVNVYEGQSVREEVKGKLDENGNVTNFSGIYYYLPENYFSRDWTTEKEKENVEENISREQKWYQFTKDTAADVNNELYNYLKYRDSFSYGRAKTMYHIVNPTIGAQIPDGVYVYYYAQSGTKEAGTLEAATGNFEAGKEYYLDFDKSNVGKYEFEITAYSESDKVIGSARYELTVEKYDEGEEKSVFTDEFGVKYPLSPAEIYFDLFFANGFKADKNGNVIRDESNAANRDFSKYVLITGRPDMDSETIRYAD